MKTKQGVSDISLPIKNIKFEKLGHIFILHMQKQEVKRDKNKENRMCYILIF
uniref:Uncharacterized protein n=1 Tax=Rhizophora mucronata TaxID=61149 RepID=A0A2P2NHG9_RHIMU